MTQRPTRTERRIRRTTRAFLAALTTVVSLLSCENLLGPLNNPVDPNSDEYQGYESVDSLDEIATVAIEPGELTWIPDLILTAVEGADRYAFEVVAGNTWNDTTVWESEDGTHHAKPSSAAFTPGTYLWRGRARRDGVWGPWSEPGSFRLAPAVVTTSPIDGAITDFSPTFTWDSQVAADSYEVEIAVAGSGFASPLSETTTGRSYTVDAPLAGGTYEWRVRAVEESTEGLRYTAYATAGYRASVAGDPIFDPPPGTYVEDTVVTLGTETQGETVHYTTDGTEPTSQSPAYDGAISVSGDGTTVTIKALAYADDSLPSDVVAGTYTIDYDAATVALTLSADSGGSIDSTTPIETTIGTPVSISATPSIGYHFDRWTATTGAAHVTFGDAASAATTAALTGPASIHATFALNSYAITSTAGTGGSADVPANADHGAPVSISATPDTGYHFAGWTATAGAEYATFEDAAAATTTVTLTGPAAIHATFTINSYAITSAAGTGGSADVPANADHGTPVTISATPSTGYYFAGWAATAGAENVAFADPSAASTTVTLTGPATIAADFDPNTYRMTLLADTGGTVTPNGTVDALHGEEISIAAMANDTYAFVGWTADVGTVEFGNPDRATTTATLLGRDATIRAEFSATAYELSVDAGVGGSTLPSGAVLRAPDTAYPIAATPSTGYHFVEWTATSGAADVTFGNSGSATTTATLTGPATIAATFAINTYALASTAGTGGTVSVPATGTHGEAVSISATPSTGYHFVSWTASTGADNVTFGNLGDATTTATITGPATITATFAHNTYALASTAGSGGTVSAPASGDHGRAVSISATPNTGYHFVEWTATTGATYVTFGDSGDATTTVTLTGAATIRASFAINTYSLTSTAGLGGTVSTPAMGDHGEAVSISATPITGYHFVGWTATSGAADIEFGDSGNATTTVTLTGPAAITATFAISTYALASTAGSGGTVSVPATGDHGQAVSISAAPSTGYHFVAWTATTGADNVTFGDPGDATTTATLTGTATIVATFAINSYSLSVNADPGGTILAPVASPAEVDHGDATTIVADPQSTHRFAGWTVTSGSGVSFANASAASTTVTLTGGPATIAAEFEDARPAAPGQLSRTGATTSSISIAWTDNAADETGYRVKRGSMSGGPYSIIADTLPVGTSAYTDNGASEGTVYYYIVEAYNAYGTTASAELAAASVADVEIAAIVLTTPTDYTIDLGDWDGILERATSESVDLTATISGGADAYTWYLDGVTQTTPTPPQTIHLSADDIPIGGHRLVVVATKSGVPWSADVTFEVRGE